jgi:hypothetical protein
VAPAQGKEKISMTPAQGQHKISIKTCKKLLHCQNAIKFHTNDLSYATIKFTNRHSNSIVWIKSKSRWNTLNRHFSQRKGRNSTKAQFCPTFEKRLIYPLQNVYFTTLASGWSKTNERLAVFHSHGHFFWTKVELMKKKMQIWLQVEAHSIW